MMRARDAGEVSYLSSHARAVAWTGQGRARGFQCVSAAWSRLRLSTLRRHCPNAEGPATAAGSPLGYGRARARANLPHAYLSRMLLTSVAPSFFPQPEPRHLADRRRRILLDAPASRETHYQDALGPRRTSFPKASCHRPARRRARRSDDRTHEHPADAARTAAAERGRGGGS